MTTELTKAAQQALEALIEASGHVNNEPFVKVMMARDALVSALTQHPAAQEVDWRTPTTYAQRFTDAVSLLCREAPPSDMVSEWIDRNSDDHRLQDWACERAPAWAQGIGLLDAAHVMASQPTEGVEHEPAPQQATPEPLIVKGAMAGMVDAQVRDLWPTKDATPEPVGEPYGWHYSTSQGASVLHLQPSCRLEADMDAAARWPAHHKCTPLFTRPAPGVPEDVQREIAAAQAKGGE